MRVMPFSGSETIILTLYKFEPYIYGETND